VFSLFLLPLRIALVLARSVSQVSLSFHRKIGKGDSGREGGGGGDEEVDGGAG